MCNSSSWCFVFVMSPRYVYSRAGAFLSQQLQRVKTRRGWSLPKQPRFKLFCFLLFSEQQRASTTTNKKQPVCTEGQIFLQNEKYIYIHSPDESIRRGPSFGVGAGKGEQKMRYACGDAGCCHCHRTSSYQIPRRNKKTTIHPKH